MSVKRSKGAKGPTRGEQKAETRLALLGAARACFERQGYAATTIGDIAREAGVAHGTFYVHFTSREAAADALLEAFNEHLGARLAPLLAPQTGPRAVGAIVRSAARLFLAVLDEERVLVRFYAERAAHGLPADALATGINPPALTALTEAMVARFAAEGPGGSARGRVDLAAHGLLALWLRIGLRYALVRGTKRADAEETLVLLTVGALRALIHPEEK